MLVFVVIAVTAAITNGQISGPDLTNITFNRAGQDYTTIPDIPEGVRIV